MNREAKYKADQLIEAGVAQYLDEFFYVKLSADVDRWHDKAHQFAGIDVTLKNVNFDEKAKVRGCLNSAYGYPSFEVSIMNKAYVVQDGWFTQELSTDYYAIVGVWSYNSEDYDPKDKVNAAIYENAISAASEISACDLLWVKKQDVVDMIEEHMTISQLKQDARELRDAECAGKSRQLYPHRKFWLTYSSWMHEKPVNLVVPRKTLEQLPHSKHFIITREKVKKV